MSRKYVRTAPIRTTTDIVLSLVSETPSTVEELAAVSKKAKSGIQTVLISLEKIGRVKRDDFFHHSGQVIDIWSFVK